MGSRRIGGVVFDMDGLMLDTESIYKATWQQAARELGFPLDDAFYLTLVGRPNIDGEREIARKFGEAFPLDEFQARWPVLWRGHVEQHGIPRKPGLIELLDFLDERGLKRAVATSSERDYTDFSLGHAGLGERFAVFVTGEEVKHGKPAPDIYAEAARRLGLHPAECVALEDSDAGILAASRAGMTALLIPDLKSPSEEAKKAAAGVFPTLHEARAYIGSLIAS